MAAGEVAQGRAERLTERLRCAGPEWIGAIAAARALSVTYGTVITLTSIDKKSASLLGKPSARGAGALFRRADIERLNAIRRRCRLSVGTADRVLSAIKAGGAL